MTPVPIQSTMVRRTYYGSGTVTPQFYDDVSDGSNDDVLDTVLKYGNQFQVDGYAWDENLGIQVPVNVGPVYETPSYSNAGGTGDRTGIIIASTNLTTLDGGDINDMVAWVDGIYGTQRYWLIETVSGKYCRFHFLSNAVLITEATFYGGGGSSNNGTWKWQGSHDGSTWTDIGNSFLFSSTTTPQPMTTMAANTSAYEYYQLLGVSGNTDVCYCVEFEFKIGNPI